MKRLYIFFVAIASLCYTHAQDKIYVHQSNGSILAIALEQLDSVSFLTTDANLQLYANQDIIRVGETLPLHTNILTNSLMDVAWTVSDNQLLTITGAYNEGLAKGLQPGKAQVQAACDGAIATYPITIIGKATSTGAPKTHWDVMTDNALSGDNVAFIAQYDSKDNPVDYSAVWYDIVETEKKSANCALITAVDYDYTINSTTQTIQPLSEAQRYPHSSQDWNDSTQSFLLSNTFPVALHDTLMGIHWSHPHFTDNLQSQIATYLGENFVEEFKDGLTSKLNPSGMERNYDAYTEVFRKLNLLDYDEIQSMTSATYNANSGRWENNFKQYDSLWSTTHFDTIGVIIDSTMRVTGRPPYRDTIWTYDTTYTLQPKLEGVEYVYDQIIERVDRLWRDSVHFLDLVMGEDGYELEYHKDYLLNAEYRIYDKQGNMDKTTPHTITLDNNPERINIIAPTQPIVVRQTPVTLQVGAFYTKRQGTKHYTWTFPDGTQTTTGEAFHTYEGETTPALLFSHVGGQKVTCAITINGVRMLDEIVNINVGYDKEAPTLYFAACNGNIMAMKLTNGNQPTDMQVLPYDLGVSAGRHPFNILFHDSSLYVLDAGKQFTYINDNEGVLGDGKISVVAKDGSSVQTMITNVGQNAFEDPFYGYIEGEYLYFADRNTGITRVPLSDRNKTYNKIHYPYFVQNNTLGYYSNGLAYGSYNGTFSKINGTWYWAKYYNGLGIFRFVDSDILEEPTALGTTPPSSGILIPGTQAKSFVYADKSQQLCFHIMDTGYNGFYAATIAEIENCGSNKTQLAAYEKRFNGMRFYSNTTGNLPAIEGYGTELVGICQMAYDENSGCVYFAYRNNSGYTQDYPPTGIYCYNPATDTITCLIEGVSAYGITINNQPSKLF